MYPAVIIYIYTIYLQKPPHNHHLPPHEMPTTPTKEMVIRAVPANMAQAPIKAYVPALASILRGESVMECPHGPLGRYLDVPGS